MIPISAISQGDRVTFFCEGYRHVATRTVKTIRGGSVIVRHGKDGDYVIHPDNIKSVSKVEAFDRGASKLDIEMRRRGVTNVDLAEKAGYSARTVTNARRGLTVKPVTMADIMQALGGM